MQQIVHLLVHGGGIELVEALLAVGVEGQQGRIGARVRPRKLGKALEALLPPRPLHPNAEVVEGHHLAQALGHGPKQAARAA